MKTKKIISIILVAALCFISVPFKAEAKKDETAKEFTEIRTIDDLYGINNDLDGNYRLMNDIDISAETAEGGSWDTGNGWTPLGAFNGEFDGNGYRIKGMHIYGDAGGDVGLFSIIDRNGKVYNLGMTDVDIEGLKEVKVKNYYSVGSIAGENGGTISECYADGKIVCPYLEKYKGCFGGITGIATYFNMYSYEWNGYVEDCYNNVDIDNAENMDNTYMDSDDSSSKYIYIGGIAGKSGYNSYRGNISKCYSLGKVSGSAICGSSSYEGKSNYYLAGSAKDADQKAKALTKTQMSVKNMYLNFDFENTWELDLNSAYKYPQLKNNRQQRVEGISIETLPKKLIYAQGEDIDTDGGTVGLTYEDNYSTTVLLTKDMLTSYDMTKTGEQIIEINYGGKTTKFKIKINGIDATDVLISGSDSMTKGEKIKLNAQVIPENATNKDIEWSSSDESVAAVDSDGNVTALQTGDVVITATASNGISASHKIKITVPCVQLVIDETELTLYKGDTKEIKTKLSPIDTTDKVEWSSSNNNIVSVTSTGAITAISPGVATVTAKAGKSSNAKDSCEITVKQKLNSFDMVGVEDKTYTGEEIKQDIKVTDGNVTLKEKEDYRVSYSDNTDVGTATITVSGVGFYEGTIKKKFKILAIKPKDDNKNDDNKDTVNDNDKKDNSSKEDDKDTVNDNDKEEDNNSKEDDKNNVNDNDKEDNGSKEDDKDTVNDNDNDKEEDNSNKKDDIDDDNSSKDDSSNTNKNNGTVKITVGKTSIKYVKNIKGKKILVQYKKVIKAAGYQIRYTLKSNMKSCKFKVCSKTKYKITSLKKNKKYYIQVRAYRYNGSKKIYGKWSSKKTVKVNK